MRSGNSSALLVVKKHQDFLSIYRNSKQLSGQSNICLSAYIYRLKIYTHIWRWASAQTSRLPPILGDPGLVLGLEDALEKTAASQAIADPRAQKELSRPQNQWSTKWTRRVTNTHERGYVYRYPNWLFTLTILFYRMKFVLMSLFIYSHQIPINFSTIFSLSLLCYVAHLNCF